MSRRQQSIDTDRERKRETENLISKEMAKLTQLKNQDYWRIIWTQRND